MSTICHCSREAGVDVQRLRAQRAPMWCGALLSVLVSPLILVSCGERQATTPDTHTPPTSIPTPIQPFAPARLQFTGNTGEGVVGQVRAILVQAYASDGVPMDADGVVVTTSDASIVSVLSRDTVSLRDGIGRRWRGLQLSLQDRAPGSAQIALRTAGASAYIDLQVLPVPNRHAVLAVERLQVFGYPVRCAWACPYLAYAPLVHLRTPAGGSGGMVEAMEFSIPTLSTGWCSGNMRFRPGMTERVNGFDPYPWANEFLLVKVDGVQVPAGLARLRVLVRDSAGALGLIDTTTTIEYLPAQPELPPLTQPGQWWSCVRHLSGL